MQLFVFSLFQLFVLLFLCYLGNLVQLLRDYLKKNRFHIAVRLFSNRSQISSKCGKNRKVAHDPLVECVADGLTIF